LLSVNKIKYFAGIIIHFDRKQNIYPFLGLIDQLITGVRQIGANLCQHVVSARNAE